MMRGCDEGSERNVFKIQKVQLRVIKKDLNGNQESEGIGTGMA